MQDRAVLLFTGGKDSIYTLHLLHDNLNLNINYVRAVIIEPSLPQPNPHIKNRDIVIHISRLLGMEPIVVGPRRIDEELVRVARGAQVIAAGDIYLIDHAMWLASIARRADVPAVYEPLFNMDTRALLKEIVDWGLEFTVIGVGSPRYRRLIGFQVNKDTLPRFMEEIEEYGIDPMGEFAEYHTLVNRVPGYPWRINYSLEAIEEEHGWLYALVKHEVIHD